MTDENKAAWPDGLLLAYYGDDFTVECPTGSGHQMNLYQVAEEISHRLANIFLKDKDGHRPVNGGEKKLQEDPHWRDCIQFYEYFHGDNGAGLGASHQTGWTGVIARAMHLFATTPAEQVLELGAKASMVETEKASEENIPESRLSAAPRETPQTASAAPRSKILHGTGRPDPQKGRASDEQPRQKTETPGSKSRK